MRLIRLGMALLMVLIVSVVFAQDETPIPTTDDLTQTFIDGPTGLKVLYPANYEILSAADGTVFLVDDAVTTRITIWPLRRVAELLDLPMQNADDAVAIFENILSNPLYELVDLRTIMMDGVPSLEFSIRGEDGINNTTLVRPYIDPESDDPTRQDAILDYIVVSVFSGDMPLDERIALAMVMASNITFTDEDPTPINPTPITDEMVARLSGDYVRQLPEGTRVAGDMPRNQVLFEPGGRIDYPDGYFYFAPRSIIRNATMLYKGRASTNVTIGDFGPDLANTPEASLEIIKRDYLLPVANQVGIHSYDPAAPLDSLTLDEGRTAYVYNADDAGKIDETLFFRYYIVQLDDNHFGYVQGIADVGDGNAEFEADLLAMVASFGLQ